LISKLTIKNYALIQDVEVHFDKGLTVITGETGAGKSIFLGALSLLLGKRADLSLIRTNEKKCIIEAHFEIAELNLSQFFNENDLDFESTTIMRREITPSGKSRAFINDSPVSLQQMQQLGSQLVDIHSQFDTRNLTSETYQLEIVDVLANNAEVLQKFQKSFQEYKTKESQLSELEAQIANAQREADYNQFLYDELEAANLKTVDQDSLETTLQELSNVESIQQNLSEALQHLTSEPHGSYESLLQSRNILSRLQSYGPNFASLWERINSIVLELDDVLQEITNTAEGIEANPALLQETEAILENIYRLQKKHVVNSVVELQEIQHNLETKLDFYNQSDSVVESLKKEIEVLKFQLNELAETLHLNRKKALPSLKEHLESYLKNLGIPQAQFDFELQQVAFNTMGFDSITLLFSANKGMNLAPLGKTASGGEMSRTMLAIKALLSSHKMLPSIIFDEIDTGVSGEVAHKMATIMEAMSKKVQLLCITHLPQIAAKGNAHKKVFKTITETHTFTDLKELNFEERVTEIAQMIGGSTVGDSAIAHAKELLN